jgi:hypothetical protein
MALTFKTPNKINIINLLLNLSMILSIVFGILDLKETFSFIKMVAIAYAILYEILMFITIYAGFRDMNIPEFMDCLENGYVQQLGFILINLLLIDTSMVGLIVGSVIIASSTGVTIYAAYTGIE